MAYVADRDATGCMLQWEAVDGADQYRIFDTDSEEEWFTVSMKVRNFYEALEILFD